MLALERGAHVIIINQAPTYLNVRADVAIMGDVASVIPAITEQVLHG
jgi:NAD-dependent SIR2 family protein deacetylase